MVERGGDATFETIYVGGGTPTVLPAESLLSLAVDLARLLKPGGTPSGAGAASGAAPASAAEFTVEAVAIAQDDTGRDGTIADLLREDAGLLRVRHGPEDIRGDGGMRNARMRECQYHLR